MMYHIGSWLAAVLALSVLTLPVEADVVLYDNSNGSFDWQAFWDGDTLPPTYFDPTLPPTQTGEPTPAGLVYYVLGIDCSLCIGVDSITASGGETRIAIGESYTVVGPDGTYEQIVTPPKKFRNGQSIGPAENWNSSAHVAWEALMGIGQHGLLGDGGYIGFRTGIAGQYRYGWIELQWLPELPIRDQYKPIRWASETQLNTPIILSIPEPASMVVLLACAAFAGGVRVPCKR